MAGNWRGASGNLFVGLAWAVAVGWWMSNTWAAWRRGRTGRWLGFNLQPLVSQGLCKMVIYGHTDGELLGAGILVVHPEASLEMLFHDVVIVAFGNHCWKTGWIWSIRHTPLWVSESGQMRSQGVTVWGMNLFIVVSDWPDEWPRWSSDLQEGFLSEETHVITEGRIWKAEEEPFWITRTQQVGF